jgi:light-regulated signal transduction histidine kinase (bacteriophytochrome)
VTPGYTIRNATLNQIPLIAIISLLVSRMAAIRFHVETTLREANEKLDERVRQRTKELEHANAALQEREAQLLVQAAELSRSNGDLEQFAYIASHDMQEPLRMIAIFTELIQENYGDKLDVEGNQFLGTVLDSARRMNLLVRDLLVYSRTIHVEPLQHKEVDSGEALRTALLNLQPLIEESGAVIHVHDLPVLEADSLRLTQVFQNLLGNAMKYRSELPPEITVSAVRIDDEWVFNVKDNGIGIHPDYHQVIFNPFKRLHGQQYSGTGVGLAICRRMVEGAGGRIWVESEPMEGAAFHFSIPAARQTSVIDQVAPVR